MATVYRAQQISLDRIWRQGLPPEFVAPNRLARSFQTGCGIVARLEHRAIVPVHDYGE